MTMRKIPYERKIVIENGPFSPELMGTRNTYTVFRVFTHVKSEMAVQYHGICAFVCRIIRDYARLVVKREILDVHITDDFTTHIVCKLSVFFYWEIRNENVHFD